MANVLDNAIGYFSPSTGKQRLLDRAAFDALRQRGYEAAQRGKQRKYSRSKGDGDAAAAPALISLREQARALDENYDIAAGVLDELVNKTIGAGLRVEPQVKTQDGQLAEAFNKALLKLHDDWIKQPEVTAELHFYACQRLLARTWFRDGEVFAQHVAGNVASLAHGTKVPYSLELLEPDLVPSDMDDDARGIYHGVRKNAWNRPTAYYVYKRHPGSRFALFKDATQVKEVSADQMIHLKLVKRLNQTRGITVFAPVLKRFDDVKDYEESERIAARVAAAMCAYIKKNDGVATSAPRLGDDNEHRYLEFQPGLVFDDLLPGEEVGTIDTKRPNAQLENFRNGQLRAVAAGTGTPFSSISKNYNGTYSAQRQEMVEHYMHYSVLRDHFVQHVLRPVWQRFVDMAALAGLLPAGAEAIDRDTLYNADFRGAGMPWIDPQKEANAAVTLYQARLKSRSQIIRDRGDNPMEVRDQIAQEIKDDEAAGLPPMFSDNEKGDETDDEENED